MQQPPPFPDGQTSRSLRPQGTRLTPVNAARAVSPVYISASERQNWPQLPTHKRPSVARRTSLLLLLYGVLLIFCIWLAYPLVFVAQPNSVAARALVGSFPWLTHLFWTQQLPALVSALARVSWLNLRTNPAQAASYLLLIALGLAFLPFFLAAATCRRAIHKYLTDRTARWLLLMLCGFTLCFGLCFVFWPGGVSQEALLSTIYARLVVVYHINPYLASVSVLAHDPLYSLLPAGTFVTPHVGPIWLDLMLPLAWLTRGEPVLALLSFRLSGLGFHLVNALLIWGILSRLRPEARLSGMLLYAWNPLLLLLDVSEMHAELVVLFFLLLGVFLIQRRILLVGWVCLLLSVLINPLCLLPCLLFLRVLARELRGLTRGRRVLWWLALLALSILVVVMACASYWAGLGLSGIVLHLLPIFWQSPAQNSLLAALAQLPLAAWPPFAWLLAPYHWLLVPALVIGILLLLGSWISDTIELALLFSSWIFLVLAVLLPVSSPWLLLIPLALALATSSRRTSLLAHLLIVGGLLAYVLLLVTSQWSGQALLTIGLPILIWGWTLFFISTWELTHSEEEANVPVRRQGRKRLSFSRPSWPSRPAAWPSQSGWRDL